MAARRGFLRRRDRGGAPSDTRFAEHAHGEPRRGIGERRDGDRSEAVYSAALMMYGEGAFPDVDGTPFKDHWLRHVASLDDGAREEFLDAVWDGTAPPWQVMPVNTNTARRIIEVSERIRQNEIEQFADARRMVDKYMADHRVDRSGVMRIQTGFEKYAHDIERLYLQAVHENATIDVSQFGPHWDDPIGRSHMATRIQHAAEFERAGRRGDDRATRADAELTEILEYLYSREKKTAECSGMVAWLGELRWAEHWPDESISCPHPMAGLTDPRWYRLADDTTVEGSHPAPVASM